MQRDGPQIPDKDIRREAGPKMSETPWGYIHAKKQNDQLGARHEALKRITRKLLNGETLTSQEKDFLQQESI